MNRRRVTRFAAPSPTLAELKRTLHLARRASDRIAAIEGWTGGPAGLAEAIDALPNLELAYRLPPAYRDALLRKFSALVAASTAVDVAPSEWKVYLQPTSGE